jgi:hypothetical protein
MRRRRSNRARSFGTACCLIVGAAATARSQSGAAQEGAPEFLLPTGARALGLGEAAVAWRLGAEAAWWNPALIARSPREASFHFAQTIATVGDYTVSVVIPVQYVGAVAITARYIDYGIESSASRTDPTEIGEFVTTVPILAASFAAPFGDRLNAGLTYKALWQLSSCTGVCPNIPTKTPATSALDFGIQYVARRDSALALGAAVRNLGLNLQVRDAPQADPLPGRLDVGISVNPKFAQLPADARMRLATDIITRLTRWDPGYRIGAELNWQNRYQARVGFVKYGLAESSGSIGIGYTAAKWQIDFADLITSVGSETGSPKFLSLRYLF